MIPDPEVRLLASLADALKPDYVDSDKAWQGSPFAWIRTRPSRQVGKIGEQLVSGYCAAKGLDVTRPTSSDHDRVIAGMKIEVKFSTLWASGGYKFQQLREQDYDAAFCLGISPFDAHAWVITKDVLRKYVIGHRPQHGGAAGTDTAWLHVNPNAPEPWMLPLGGRLADALKLLTAQNASPRKRR